MSDEQTSGAPSKPDFESRLAALEQQVEAIRLRNVHVEQRKAWETSGTRRAGIIVLTYFVMCLTFYSLGNGDVLRSSVIPTLGFFISTLSLPLLRKWWLGRRPNG